jgi:hypothetical protein
MRYQRVEGIVSRRLALTICAEALFASSLQESERPGAREIRSALADTQDHRTPDYIEGIVAQEAGDHPELWRRRMQWALHAVSAAYPPYLPAAATDVRPIPDGSAAAGTPLALYAIHIIGCLGGVFLVSAELTGRTAPAAQKEPLRVSL